MCRLITHCLPLLLKSQRGYTDAAAATAALATVTTTAAVR